MNNELMKEIVILIAVYHVIGLVRDVLFDKVFCPEEEDYGQ